MFAFKLKYLMKIADNYLDSREFDDVVANYASLKKDSFDYEGGRGRAERARSHSIQR